MQQTAGPTNPIRIPALIKRNTALFALAQSFSSTGMQLAYGLGPLMVLMLTQSPGLAGLSVGLLGISRFLVSYPVGKVTDTYGRRPGILLGQGLALLGAVAVGLSIPAQSLLLLVAGMLVFGMGMHAAQQMRVAATDMYPPRMRGEALGYIALGSVLGMIMSPLLVRFAEMAAPRIDQDPLGLPWLLMPLLIVPGMILVKFVRPDPMQIGLRLNEYYPGAVPTPRPRHGKPADFAAREFLKRTPVRLAVICNCAAAGNMAIIMVLTSLVLHHHGHDLTSIAASQALHSAGMFAFTIPLGRLADRTGRRWVMFVGVAMTLISAGFVTFSEAYWLVTFGAFLCGLGWAAANVAATALIADLASTEQRGRAIGINDTFGGAISVVMAVVTGPLIEFYALYAAGVLAILVAMMPLVMVPTLLKEITALPR